MGTYTPQSAYGQGYGAKKPLEIASSSSSDITIATSSDSYAKSSYTSVSDNFGYSAYSGFSASIGYGSAYHIPSNSMQLSYMQDEIPAERMFSFNTRLQAIYDMPSTTEEERNIQHMAFAKLNTEFTEKAIRIVKVIVEEMMLPDEQKTFASLPSAGGVAGGEKYLVDGDIFVKLCIDNHSLYGGNEWSGKVANLELHGMDGYASCIPRLPQGCKLRVPLLSMVDYVGFRALVSTACPISKRTIVYGSNDAARTVHNDDAEAERAMLLCASFLNLAPHKVMNGTSLIASAVDVEVHRGDDGNLYLIDTARVFPPVQPGVVKSVPLGDFSAEGIIHAKDLSAEQTSSLLKDLDSIPISEGLLFFKRPKPSDDPLWEASSPLPDDETMLEQDMKDENLMWMSNEDELLDQDTSFLEKLTRADANFVNPIATALVGRIIRGDAWFLRNATGQRLFHQFRPEFVRSFSKPLSSDALSGFSIDGAVHDAVVKEATTQLEQNYLVHIQTQLLSGSPYLDPWLNTNGTAQEKNEGKVQLSVAPLIYSPETLVRFMHRVGLNVRSIGHIRIHIPVQPFQAVSLVEMVSRTCVSFIKRRLRAAHSLYAVCCAHKLSSVKRNDSISDPSPSSSNAASSSDGGLQQDQQQQDQQQKPSKPMKDTTGGLEDWENLSPEDLEHFAEQPFDYLLKTIAIQAFNTIFAHSATSSFFWTQVLKVHLLVKFGADCLLSHEADRSHSLRADVPMSYLFQVISRRTGVIWDLETETQMQTAQWNSTPIALTIDHLVGFMLSIKSTKMGSLEQLKRDLHAKFFPQEVSKQRTLPLFHTSDSVDPCSPEVSDQYYSSNRTLSAPDGGGYEPFDPALIPRQTSAPTAWRQPPTPLSNPFSSSNDSQGQLPALPTSSSEPSKSSPSQPAENGSERQHDGLDLYHDRSIAYYQKWIQLMEESGVKPTPLDEVRLMLSKMRPILDNRCPGGHEQLAELDASWAAILEKIKEVPRCNQELLAQLFYARGQMLALSGSPVVDVEQYYFAALNVMAAASFPGMVLGDRAGITTQTGIPPFMLSSRRFLTHPFVMVVIEKLLILQLEANGSIMVGFPLWVLFRLVWTMCPFFGDLEARRRVFNGRDAPVAFTHAWLWEHTLSKEDNIEKRKVITSRSPFSAFMSQAVFPLDSEICQNWLAEVLSLESTCGFEMSTHWLFSDPTWFPRFVTTLFPTTSLPAITYTPNFRPLAPFNSVFNGMEITVGALDETWQWWMTFRPSNFSEFHHIFHRSGSLEFSMRIIPKHLLSSADAKRKERERNHIQLIEYYLWRQYEAMREEAQSSSSQLTLEGSSSSSSSSGGSSTMSTVTTMTSTNNANNIPSSSSMVTGATRSQTGLGDSKKPSKEELLEIDQIVQHFVPSGRLSTPVDGPRNISNHPNRGKDNTFDLGLPFVMGRYMIHETGRDFDALKQVRNLRENLNRFRAATDRMEPSKIQAMLSESAQQRFDRYYNSNEPLHGSIITFLVATHSIVGHQVADKIGERESVFGPISSRGPSSERRMIRRVQYLDPSKPAPKRYLIHTCDGPELHYALALPTWFDHIGALSLDKYDLINMRHAPRLLGRKGMAAESSTGTGFACITSQGSLVVAVGLVSLSEGEDDWAALKALDLAGEEPVLMKFARAPPLKEGTMWIVGVENAATPTVACITRSGHLFIWGTNAKGIFGNGRHGETSYSPKLVSSLMSSRTIDFDMGVGHIITLNELGIINYWGSILPETDTFFLKKLLVGHQLKTSASSYLPLEKDLPLWGNLVEQKAIAVAAGSHFVVAVSNFGIPYFYGVRHDLSNLTPTWTRVWCPERIVSVSGGDFHIVMLSENGNIFCFGDNVRSQCGTAFPLFVDGFNRCLSPLHFESHQLSGTESFKFVQIGANGNRSIALTDTGTVWSWGCTKQSSPHRIHFPQPIKYISLNSQGHHMFLTEKPDLPPRTLPLVPMQQHLETAQQIIQHYADAAEKVRKEQEQRRTARSERLRLLAAAVDDDDHDHGPDSHHASDSYRAHSSRAHSSSSDAKVVGKEQEDSIFKRASSAANSSRSWLQPKMAGEVLNVTLHTGAQFAHSEMEKTHTKEQLKLTEMFGNSQGTHLGEAIQSMILAATEPLRIKIEELQYELQRLKRDHLNEQHKN
jgi:hypothetical protein